MAKNDGGPAFPHPEHKAAFSSEGMSLRVWLAGQAMKGLMSNPVSWARVIADAAKHERSQSEQLVKMTCVIADDLLTELEKD